MDNKALVIRTPDSLPCDSDERVYCQLVNRDISALNCLQTQGQTECFACAAVSRLCEKCARRPITVTVIGMCAVCLTRAIRTEQAEEKPEYRFGERIQCQMAGGKIINTSTCFKMQGVEGCRDCTASSRLCEQCKNRKVWHPRTGLCLMHTVAEYGDGWQPLSDDVLEAIIHEEEKVVNLSQEPPDTPINTANTPAHTKDKDPDPWMTEEQYKRSFWMGAGNTRIPQESASTGELSQTDPLLQEAEAVVRKHEYASASFLQAHLNIGYAHGQKLLGLLEQRGVVGPPDKTRPRIVLAVKASETENPPELSGQVTKESARKRRSGRKEVSDDLLARARDFILAHGDTRNAALRQHLKVHSQTVTEITRRLAAEGVLGPRRYGKPRETLVPRQDKSHVEEQVPIEAMMPPHALSRTQRGERLAQLIAIVGEDSEISRDVLKPTLADMALLNNMESVLQRVAPELADMLAQIAK